MRVREGSARILQGAAELFGRLYSCSLAAAFASQPFANPTRCSCLASTNPCPNRSSPQPISAAHWPTAHHRCCRPGGCNDGRIYPKQAALWLAHARTWPRKAHNANSRLASRQGRSFLWLARPSQTRGGSCARYWFSSLVAALLDYMK